MKDYKRSAAMFKAFCDENRLKIIEELGSGEKCACHLLEELSIAQSTLSHHMKILVESSIVTSYKEGKWTHYSLSEEGLEEVQRIIGSIRQNKEACEGESCGCGTKTKAS